MAEIDAVWPVAENDRLVGMITDRDIGVRAVVLNREKRLVGILSLGNLAQVQGSQPARQALAGISQPSGDRA